MPSLPSPVSARSRTLQTRRRLQDLEVLYKISNIINTTQDRGKVLKAVLKEVVRITGATSGSIAILDEKKGILNIESAINIPTQTWRRLKLQLGLGVTGWAAYKGVAVRVADVRNDARYVAIKPDIRSELAVPMLLKGRVIGVINVDSTRIGAFTDDDERLLVAVAEQSSRVFETARLYGKAQRHAEQLETLLALSRRLATPAPTSGVVKLAASEGRELLEVDACVFLEVLEEGAAVEARAQSGDFVSFSAGPWSRTAGTLLMPVTRRAKILTVPNLKERRPFWLGTVPGIEDASSLLAVPVVYRDHILGVLLALSEAPREFTDSETRLFELLANQVAVALENARRSERIMQMEDNLHKAERFSLLGTLAAEIAHEIRNPVTIINLLLESVVEATTDNEQASHDLGIIREKLDRIERIVNQTLSMSRDRDPQRERVDINRAISDMLMFMNYKFDKGNVEVRPSLGDDLPAVLADPGHVQQVLLNLIINAQEAMPTGGRLGVRTRRASDPDLGECVCISVQDTGQGIDPGSKEQLFEPFFTTREKGTGLGLFISRKLVTANKGDIRVRAREGGGTSFDVFLPAAATDATLQDGTAP